MLRRYQHVVAGLFRAADVCLIVGCWLVAYWIRVYTPPHDTLHRLPSFEVYASLSPLVAVLWLLVLTLGGAYESARMRGRRSEVLDRLAQAGCTVTVAGHGPHQSGETALHRSGVLGVMEVMAHRVAADGQVSQTETPSGPVAHAFGLLSSPGKAAARGLA